MKATIGETIRKIAPYTHTAFLDRDYVNEQDRPAVATALKPYSNVKVSIEKTRHDDGYLDVAYRELQEYWKTPVGLILVLAGAADMDILISLAPVCGKSLVESLRALGDEIELKI